MEILFDPILGKLRQRDEGSGPAGPACVVGDDTVTEAMLAQSMKASGVVEPVSGEAAFDMADGGIFTLTLTEATELTGVAAADFLNRTKLGIVDGEYALTFPLEKYIVLAGEYVTTKINYIYFHCIEAGATPKFLITFSQEV